MYEQVVAADIQRPPATVSVEQQIGRQPVDAELQRDGAVQGVRVEVDQSPHELGPINAPLSSAGRCRDRQTNHGDNQTGDQTGAVGAGVAH